MTDALDAAELLPGKTQRGRRVVDHEGKVLLAQLPCARGWWNSISARSASANPSTAPSGGAQCRSRRACGAMSWNMR